VLLTAKIKINTKLTILLTEHLILAEKNPLEHLVYMRRAQELALLGMGTVSPNPMVGCVIVHDGRIIGEGFHRTYGGPHAEVHAIESVADKSLLAKSTVYVSLEPCAHHGRTPPCASLLVAHSVQQVIIANTDPNPLVAGKGISILREAGIEVHGGFLEAEGLELNRRFFTFHQKKRPYIILKWAQTADGFIARKDNTSKWISGPWARKLVHKWRSEEDAILVGRRTAETDNPSLTTRNWHGKDPLRLVLDPALRLKPDLHLFDGSVPTVCYTATKVGKEDKTEYVAYGNENPLLHMLQDLHQRNILSLIVEGGSATLQRFVDAGLWDEARIFTAPMVFNEGIPAPRTNRAVVEHTTDIDGDRLTVLRRKT
jgi:diaminohydroxyphosphoribosylaminopyrimidine deaminase/5-amino-6-(5-phosphoribosylamino)uracil reductase